MSSADSIPLPPMSPALWGTPAEAHQLGDDVRGLVEQVLEVTPSAETDLDPEGVRVLPSRLDDAAVAALAEIVGTGNVTRDRDHLLRRARGKSTPDLLSWRVHDEVRCPDAAVAPRTDAEVAELLRWCAGNDVAVVPFGGGTSVVGGVEPEAGDHRAVVSVDLAHFRELEELDTVSGEAVLGAGLPGPEAERLLGERGWSLGHFPQSFPYATIGGFAMTRSSGQDSAGYGRFDQMVTGLDVVTPAGPVHAGRVPASAAGPDLRQLFLGSEGAFGICTRVRVRVHPVPECTRHEAFSFPDFATGAAALRAVEQQGTGPTVLRLSDETETSINLAMTSRIGSEPAIEGCLAIALFEGTEAAADSAHERTRALLLELGGTSLGAEPARAWEEGRFGAPVMRDALLDAGALCETLETATHWSRLAELKTAVTEALTTALEATGTPALVMCHISHVYPTGASLYFTVVAGRRGEDPIAQWAGAKKAAAEAIMAGGGTITHHHAVGRDHRPWLEQEIGSVGVQVLRAVKSTLDPDGIMNPGALVP